VITFTVITALAYQSLKIHSLSTTTGISATNPALQGSLTKCSM